MRPLVQVDSMLGRYFNLLEVFLDIGELANLVTAAVVSAFATVKALISVVKYFKAKRG